MTFIWPQMLWLLTALIPLTWLAIRWARKGSRSAWPGLKTPAGAPLSGRGWLHRLPIALALTAGVLWCLAAARPASVITLPSPHETVILAIDASGSMRATDMAPNRLAAAQAAARAFIAQQPRSTRIGIVGFAGTASLVQPPTDRRDDILQSIERLQPQRGTAIGSAIVVSLAAIFPGTGIDLNSVSRHQGAGPRPGSREDRRDAARDAGGGGAAAPGGEAPQVEPGTFDSAVIVLMTDGQSTAGPDPVAAARLAASRGVRVYTVGIGTSKGEVMRSDGWSMRVALDEVALKTVADLTRGEYFQAASAGELERVYRSLNSRFVTEKKEIEVGALFSVAATCLALAAAALSMLRSGRIV